MPSDKSLSRMRTFVEKYLNKTGTSRHENAAVTEAVINGLASNLDELRRPLCPCKFFPHKKAEVERSREWICACDDMKRYKYCHCLLFVTPEGLPITEYLGEDHDGRVAYGLVRDPTPDRGREGSRSAKRD